MTMLEVCNKIIEVNKKEPKIIEHKLLKMNEEVGELSEAVLSSQGVSGTAYKKKTKDDVAEEAIDVLIMALSIILEIVSVKQMIAIMITKINKWERNINN